MTDLAARYGAVRAVLGNLGTACTNLNEGGSSWVKAKCPLAPWDHASGSDTHPSFGVNVEHQDLLSNCYGCGFLGSLGALVTTIHRRMATLPKSIPNLNLNEAYRIVADIESSVYVPPIRSYPTHETVSYDLLGYDHVISRFVPIQGTPGEAYMVSRGVPLEWQAWMDLRFDPQKNRVVFLERNFYGDLAGMRGRSIIGEDPKYWVYKGVDGYKGGHWYGEDKVNLDDTVIMVESVMDYAKVVQVFPNVVAPMTCTFSKTVALRMSGAPRVITVFDTGQGGDVARRRITQHYDNNNLIHLLPVGAKDPGDMSLEAIYNLIAPAYTYLHNPLRSGSL